MPEYTRFLAKCKRVCSLNRQTLRTAHEITSRFGWAITPHLRLRLTEHECHGLVLLFNRISSQSCLAQTLHEAWFTCMDVLDSLNLLAKLSVVAFPFGEVAQVDEQVFSIHASSLPLKLPQ